MREKWHRVYFSNQGVSKFYEFNILCFEMFNSCTMARVFCAVRIDNRK